MATKIVLLSVFLILTFSAGAIFIFEIDPVHHLYVVVVWVIGLMILNNIKVLPDQFKKDSWILIGLFFYWFITMVIAMNIQTGS